MNIPFNCPTRIGTEESLLSELLARRNYLSSDQEYVRQAERFLEERFAYRRVLLTQSCTAALEICALLLRGAVGSRTAEPEVIMPSFTFVSTANAFAKFGFRIRWVDIHPATMNLDEAAVADAINRNTVAVVAVDYGGISADLRRLRTLCDAHQCYLIEDAAQAIDAWYGDRPLGGFGDLATVSFHGTKNITAGEGGCLVANNDKFLEAAEAIREKGTDRLQFFAGRIDKYTWVTIGGHYLISEINAAFLLAQLRSLGAVTARRVAIWDRYQRALQPLARDRCIEIQTIPPTHTHNGHMFWLKCRDAGERTRFIAAMHQQGIATSFHYVPLHASAMGKLHGRFHGEDRHTTREADRLARLPLFYNLCDDEVERVIRCVGEWFAR